MRVLAPLRQKDIALLWGGLAISAVGDQLYLVALVWIATRLLAIIGSAGAANSEVMVLALLAIGAATAGVGGPMQQVTANTLQYVRFAPAEIAAIDRRFWSETMAACSSRCWPRRR